MKFISILERPTIRAIQIFAEQRNLVRYLPRDYQHPQEDYFIASESPPVFVVADGVTLNFQKLAETNTKYPNPSPAGKVAKIFCEAVIRSVTDKYETIDEEKLRIIFAEANSKVAKYNQRVGKSDISGNITGFYAATGSFVILKGGKAYWATICDSFVAHFNQELNLKFMSSGSCSPYAVINGEERMVGHLEEGVCIIEEGDRIFVFTDGFEHYVKNPDFLKLFKNWAGDLQKRIANFSREMNLKDPEKYGHERTLIAISI